ncbi:MAG: hypothetical protein FWD74_04575 [Actinomycetia bacterium]|nr:hypothetical protein [Actinomycetes bacterium]
MSDPIERRLRDSLARHAEDAPRGADLAERIIASAQRNGAVGWSGATALRRWRAWLMPLIAAVSVAAVVGGLFAAGALGDSNNPSTALGPASTAPTGPTAGSAPPTAPVTTGGAPSSGPVLTPSPDASGEVAPDTAATSRPGATSAPVAPTGAGAGAGGDVPKQLYLTDTTFVGADEGWALGTGLCLDGSGKRCATMIHTGDGGASWASVPNPPANVEDPFGVCAAPCVSHLRFATDRIGYAYGPDVLFMTTDGQTWVEQPGAGVAAGTTGAGAVALETLDGNVIRVSAPQLPCPAPGCQLRVQIAAIGSTSWSQVTLPGRTATGDDVSLTRVGSAAYLLDLGDTAAALYSSTDDGRRWVSQGDPCAKQQAGASANWLTSAADGSVTLLCSQRGGAGTYFTLTSTDGGASFRAGSAAPAGTVFVGASSATVLLATDQLYLYRSANGGASWRRVAAVPGAQAKIGTSYAAGISPTPIGFESATTGRWIYNWGDRDGAAIWTTTDAGLTWTSHAFN